jgi:5,10-methylenetetrahydromethanopterin reductase/phthiodiolone/phenolphthiodiolone dimycocerosates ketoreductase
LALVKKAARTAGRSLDEIEAGLYLYTSIADKAEDAYKQLDTMKPMIVSAPELLPEAGYDVELPEDIRSLSYTELLPTSKWIDAFTRYGEFIPREAAIEFSIAGTTQDCIDKIDEFVKAGVRHFLLINLGPSPRKVVEIYSKEIIPRFAE